LFTLVVIDEFPAIIEYEKFIKHFRKSETELFKPNKDEELLDEFYDVESILNTPLYRLYAENNTFDTLNMIKPIKIKHSIFKINPE